MSDSTLNRFVSAGTAAQRAAFTPTPPTPASGPTPGYFWHETDTGDTYSWKAGTGWIKVNTASGGLLAANNLSDVASATTSRTNLGVGTADSPQFTGVNVGHASDTTITRASAGVIAVEGVNVVTTAGGVTFAADISVPDEAYDATNWNGSLEVPTKNAVRDKIESLSAGGWTEALFYDAASVNTQSIECNVTGAKEIMILGNDLVNSSSVQRMVQCSVDGGSTWYTTSGDYDEVPSSGAQANNAAFFAHATATTAARTIAVYIVNNGFSRIPHAFLQNRGVTARFKGSTTAINRIRVTGGAGGTGTPAGNYTAGTVQVLTR